MQDGAENGLDRMDSLFVRVDELVKDRYRRRRRRFAPSLTSSSTRTTCAHAIKAAIPVSLDLLIPGDGLSAPRRPPIVRPRPTAR